MTRTPSTASSTHSAELEITVDRTLVRSAAHSDRFVRLVVVAPSGDPTTSRPPLRIGFAIDRSGSMHGLPMQCARDAVLAGMRLLGPDDEATVVAFDTEIETTVPLTAAREGLGVAERELPRLDARGCTNLSGGWLQACQYVGAASERPYNRRVIVLTDGHANEGITDATELARHATELRLRGLTTATLGLGAGFEEGLLSSMAEAGGGAARFAATPGEIERAITECVSDALETTLSAAEVLIQVPGAEFELLTAGASHATPGALRVSLGDLASNQEREVVVRVRLPLGDDGEIVALTATLSGADQAGAAVTAHAASYWTYAGHRANDTQPRDRSVDRVVALLYAARARQRAVPLNRGGDFQAARRELEAVARRIESYAGGDGDLLEIAAALRLEAETFSLHMDELRRKAAHFTSSAMLHSSLDDGGTRRRTRS